MPDTNLKFHSHNGKRQILIVEDEMINREILGAILEEKYEVLFAETGAEALDAIRAYFDTLSLILLDLILPDMNGLDILRNIKAEEQLARIPVIVMTSDRQSEVESLNAGASDFIPKPYPVHDVIHARVRRTIELSEDRDIIRQTERDHLTQLYNREFFYRYAEQYDMYHKNQSMDAIVMDINHFHLINERYGRAQANELLRQIGSRIRDLVSVSGGIVCRREADTFLIYCPHRNDYSQLLEAASADLESSRKFFVRLRMGVYSDVDKQLDIERRFDRAQMAADTVRSSFTKAVAIYDNALHESELFAERLLESFPAAIEQKQFHVHFQPKYDIRHTEPLLAGAEALVRWQHPDLGMISPGVFIPLFESNGLIRELDNYIWRETARQVSEWKNRHGFIVPVSVNVSRIDLLDPELTDNLCRLIEEFHLDYKELHLEITESAYTQDSTQIISRVTELRSLGFVIEMDDFGSGYSSLNMVSALPIDALKLDMQFLRTAFSERKNTRMLEVIFDIADSLSVPTIAEGVETAEQLFTLKAMGCDLVQGFYLSKPIPADKFEQLLLARKEIDEAQFHPEKKAKRESISRAFQEKFTYDALHDPLTGLYNHSGFEMLYRDADKEHLSMILAEIPDLEDLPDAEADETARTAAITLRRYFRSVDYICRLRKNEFVILLARSNSSMADLFEKKLSQVRKDLAPVRLITATVFCDLMEPGASILHEADILLSQKKEASAQ